MAHQETDRRIFEEFNHACDEKLFLFMFLEIRTKHRKKIGSQKKLVFGIYFWIKI